MKTKVIFTVSGIVLLLVGFAVGYLLTTNYSPLIGRLQQLGLIPGPSPQVAGATDCQTQTLGQIGVTLCLPPDWFTRSTEGPRQLQLAKVVIQSPDFDQITDQSLTGLPTVSIRGGYQFSVTVSRITLASNLSDFTALKNFWIINRAGHAISRQEDLTVGGEPALYHYLVGPKVGNQVDTHMIKDPLLYDINFYYNGTISPGAEDLYRKILSSIKFVSVDPQMASSDPRVRVLLAPTVSTSKPLTITVTTDFTITSAAELPTLIRQTNPTGQNPATVIGTALPVIASDSAGLETSRQFEFTWNDPAFGDQIFAQVIKNDGEIIQSAPVSLGIPKGYKPATSSAVIPGTYP